MCEEKGRKKEEEEQNSVRSINGTLGVYFTLE